MFESGSYFWPKTLNRKTDLDARVANACCALLYCVDWWLYLLANSQTTERVQSNSDSISGPCNALTVTWYVCAVAPSWQALAETLAAFSMDGIVYLAKTHTLSFRTNVFETTLEFISLFECWCRRLWIHFIHTDAQHHRNQILPSISCPPQNLQK